MKFADFVYFVYYAITSKCGKTFPHIIQKYIKNLHTSQEYILHILQYSMTKRHNFTTKFKVLFSHVLIDIPNSRVCLI